MKTKMTTTNPLFMSSLQMIPPPPSYYYYNDSMNKNNSNNNQQQQQQQQEQIIIRPNILSYSYQWKQYQQQQKQQQSNYNDTVFGLSFLNNNNNNNNNNTSSSWLAGCTKSGYICIWLIENNNYINNNNNDDDNDNDNDNTIDNHSSSNNNNNNNNNSHTNKTLVWSQQVVSNVNGGGSGRASTNNVVLYECKFIPSCFNDNNNNSINNTNKNMLVVSGDGGIYLYDFDQQIVPQIELNLYNNNNNNNNNNTKQDASTNKNKNTNNIIPTVFIQPLHIYLTYPSPYGSTFTRSTGNRQKNNIEINNFIVKDNHLYGAAGDSFCYKWNIHTQQCIQTYHNSNNSSMLTTTTSTTSMSNNDYLQTIESIPNTNLIVTGSDCGIVSIWDTNHDTIVDQYNMKNILTNYKNYTSINNNNNDTTNSDHDQIVHVVESDPISSCSISSCIAKDENFWIVAGGTTSTSTSTSTNNISTSNNNNKRPRNTIFGTSTSNSISAGTRTGSSSFGGTSSGGYMATIHGPTRTWISVVNTIETPNQLAMIDTTNTYTNSPSTNTNNTTNMNSNTIVSVSNDNYIRFWDTKVVLNQQQQQVQVQQQQLQQPCQKIQCNTPCGYSISVNPISSQLAVAGVGTIINLYDNYNQPSSIPINIHKYY